MWVVASPPWRRGPQVRAPWHHGGHGAVDAVRPVAPPGRASGRGVAGVYTDRRKRPLGAVLGHSCTLLRRCNTARPAGDGAGATKEGRACGLAEGRLLVRRLTKRRSLRLPCCAECAFPSHHRPGGAGPNPPPACGALWRVAQLGKRARATPRQAAGGLRRGSQAPAWGLAARKGAVWTEGLAEGAPWARPGHRQAASCGLRRCRELRIAGVFPWTALRYRSS